MSCVIDINRTPLEACENLSELLEQSQLIEKRPWGAQVKNAEEVICSAVEENCRVEYCEPNK